MKATKLTASAALAASLMLWVGTTHAVASIIFADFNTNEGTFSSAPNGSGTTNFDATSTADRTTTDSFEGAGSELLDLIHTSAATTIVNI